MLEQLIVAGLGFDSPDFTTVSFESAMVDGKWQDSRQIPNRRRLLVTNIVLAGYGNLIASRWPVAGHRSIHITAVSYGDDAVPIINGVFSGPDSPLHQDIEGPLQAAIVLDGPILIPMTG